MRFFDWLSAVADRLNEGIGGYRMDPEPTDPDILLYPSRAEREGAQRLREAGERHYNERIDRAIARRSA